MSWTCPEDLADALRRLLTDTTFELRALRDLRRAMTEPEDAAAAARTAATCDALEDLARHLLPLLEAEDHPSFCWLLEWHWNHERPAFCARLDADAIAFATMTVDDYDDHWRALAPLARRELARYPALVRRHAG